MAEIVQGSPEWLASRLGKVTASRIVDVTAKVKSGEAAARANYRAQLVCERLTGRAEETFSSAAMKWGTDTEPFARAAYEAETGLLVVECAMIDHPTIAMSGASPDGLVSTDGLVEIKCPHTATHIDTLLARKAPAKYVQQMQWQMACTGRAWCHFVSFDPRLTPELQMFVTRVERDDALIEQLEAEVSAFLAEVDEMIEKLTKVAA